MSPLTNPVPLRIKKRLHLLFSDTVKKKKKITHTAYILYTHTHTHTQTYRHKLSTRDTEAAWVTSFYPEAFVKGHAVKY